MSSLLSWSYLPWIIHKMNDPGCLFIVQDIAKKSKFEMPAGFFLIS